jgi:hypothetical protein
MAAFLRCGHDTDFVHGYTEEEMKGNRLSVRVGVVVVTLMLALSVGVGLVLAAPSAQDVPQAPSLVELLTRLAGGGCVGVIVAFLFEKIEWFQKLPPDVKWWAILGMSVGLPVLATALLQFVPADVWAQLAPYWKSLATGFLIWAGSQVAHRLNVQHSLT